jgi:hypothetical protein
MDTFTFYYNGKTENAFMEHFYEEGYNRFRIIQPDLTVVIAPAGVRTAAGKIVWVQTVKPLEFVQPHDYMQAMGEGLERHGFYS